jgi:hypothetical protein
VELVEDEEGPALAEEVGALVDGAGGAHGITFETPKYLYLAIQKILA